MKKLIFFSLLSVVFLSPDLFAWDFSNLRASLHQDLSAAGPHKPRVALVYKTVDRSKLQRRFNLVEIKRQLAHEMARSFQVPDPILTAQVLRKNKLTYDRLLSDASLTEAFANRTQAELVLLISIEPVANNLGITAKLINSRNQPLSNHSLELSPKGSVDHVLGPASSSVVPAQVVSKKRTQRLKQQQNTVSQYGGEVMSAAREFLADHNDSWIAIHPTAFLNPMPNFFELTLWPKNLPDTDVRPKRVRYEYTLEGLGQMGVQVFGNDNFGTRSAYVHVKLAVVQVDDFALALGYRRRVFWNRENLDFKQGYTSDKLNDKRNKSTLFAVATYKEQSFGVMLNGYINNQTVGLGAKYMITDDLMAVVDGYATFYDHPVVQNNGVAGLEFQNPMGGLVSLVYELESKQAHLSLGYSF